MSKKFLFHPGGDLSRERKLLNIHKLHQAHQEIDKLAKEDDDKVAWVPTFEEVLEAKEEEKRVQEVASKIDNPEQPLPISREEYNKLCEELNKDDPETRKNARLSVKFRQLMNRLREVPNVVNDMLASGGDRSHFLFFPAAAIEKVDPDIEASQILSATGARLVDFDRLPSQIATNYAAAPSSFVDMMYRLQSVCLVAVCSGQDIIVWTLLHPDHHPFSNGVVGNAVAMEIPNSIQLEQVFHYMVKSPRFRMHVKNLVTNATRDNKEDFQDRVLVTSHEDFLLLDTKNGFEVVNQKILQKGGHYYEIEPVWRRVFYDWRVWPQQKRRLPASEGVSLQVYGDTINLFTQIYWHDDPKVAKHRFIGLRLKPDEKPPASFESQPVQLIDEQDQKEEKEEKEESKPKPEPKPEFDPNDPIWTQWTEIIA